MTKRNIFLVGLMGVGKTCIGKALGQELHLTFYDSDLEIERRSGTNIPWIFDIEGEAGFRQREMKAIDALTQLDGIVLATGGGAVLYPQNRQLLAGRGIVIYLHANIEDLLERTSRNLNRPLLANGNPREVLEKLLVIREPLYREIADYVYNTSGRAVNDITADILRDLKTKKYF